MIPPQVAVEIFGGGSAVVTEKVLEALMAAVDRLNVEIAAHSLAWFSSQWPGVPYPYEKTTVFQGGAGMEYPMMVNDESYKDTTFADLVEVKRRRASQ